MTLVWPNKLLSPNRLNLDLAPRTLRGSASVSGSTQVISSGAGLWKATLHDVPIATTNAIKTWRALAAILEGQLTPILLPLFSFEQSYNLQPYAEGSLSLIQSNATTPHSDNTLFSDGAGYQSGFNDISINGAVSAGATSAVLNIQYGGTIEPSHIFSVGERGYRIRTAEYVTESQVAVTFYPPAREAFADGDIANFDNPAIRMRLASDAEMELEINPAIYGFKSVSFIEDV